MGRLLRRSASAGARPCQGRSSLDTACAPAEYGSYQEARTGMISQIEVSTLSAEPRESALSVKAGQPQYLMPGLVHLVIGP
jgi:hypothetical protein